MAFDRRAYMREYMRRRNGTETRSCAWCAGEVVGRKRRYCDSSCATAANRWSMFCRYEAADPVSCVVCGESFVRYGRSEACSPACGRRLDLLKRYGLTPDSYAHLLESQGDCCAACGGGFGAKGPQIDHCHSSGHVRGVLCTSCNLAIGHAQDDQERVFCLAAYLARDEFDLRELCVS